MSEDAGLEVACYTFLMDKFFAGEPDWLDEAKQAMEDAALLGAPVAMVPTMARPEQSRNEFRRFWIEGLRAVLPFAEDAGVVLTVENFPTRHSAFVTADDFLLAKRELPSLRLTYDNGNAAGGEDPVESYNKCADDVVHVHFKDWYIRDEPGEGYREQLSGKYFKPALIGEGDLDTAACWNALGERGYDRFINIEYEGDDHRAHEGIRQAVEYLRGL